MAGKTFATIEEELQYYKNEAATLRASLKEAQEDLDEFQTSSRELEEELVKELESSEKRLAEIKTKNEILKNDIDEWKQKYYQSKSEYNITTTQMQRELDTLQNLKETYVVKTRELELDNDDLERTERAAKSSLQDLENKYNKAIERNVILENELEGKSQLIVQVQRLKDELRDVNIELAIMRNKEDGEFGPPPTSSAQRVPLKREIYTSRPPSIKSMDSADAVANPVKMVQEMVGRVKSLEARLVSCRSLVTPLLAPPPSYSANPGHMSPPQSPKYGRGESPVRLSLKTRTPSYQKSKEFSIPTNQYRHVINHI